MFHLPQNLRLIRLLSEKTQTEFGEMFGGATKAMVISYEKGKASPDEVYIARVAKYAGVTPDQLKSHALSEDEINIKVEKVEKEESYMDKRRGNKNRNQPYMAPFFPVKAQAGYVKAVDQEVYMDTLERYALPPGISPAGANWRYWEIQGDSMQPNLKSGDIILTSQVHHMDWDHLRNFYVYVIVTKEAVLCKRLFCKNDLEWVLISDNEESYPQQLIAVEDIQEVWVFRRKLDNQIPPPKMFEIKV